MCHVSGVMQKIKVIFIPGNGGGGREMMNPLMHQNWKPWLKDRLEELGIDVVAKDWPDPDLARSKFWLPHIKKLGANEKTILIGNSSGAVAAMRYAEKYQVLGLVLVAACYTDLGMETEKISGYFDKPWQWEKIKKNTNWIVQFASLDDPFIPISEARFMHEMLETEYYEFENEGHFGYPNPKLEFPELVESVKNKLRRYYL